MVESDLRGIDSHGIGKIKLYERHVREGRINPAPEIRLVRDLPAIALIDGDNGMGHLSSKFAMETAIAKAGEEGVGAVSVRHSYHIGACGIYSGMAAAAGMIGFAMTGATQLTMVPTFGRTSRSEEHTSELQSLMRISYAVFCLKKKKKHTKQV